MRGRPVAWKRRRIVLLVHYLDVVSRAAIEAAIVPKQVDDHRSASGVAIPAPGRGDPRAGAKQWPCLPGTHITSHFRTSCSPSGRTGTRAGPDGDCSVCQQRDTRSSAPTVARPSRAWLPSQRGWVLCGPSLSAVRWLTTVRAPLQQPGALESAPSSDDQRWRRFRLRRAGSDAISLGRFGPGLLALPETSGAGKA